MAADGQPTSPAPEPDTDTPPSADADTASPGLAATADTLAPGGVDAGSADTGDEADPAKLGSELDTLLAEMRRAPTPELAARLSALGHVEVFRGANATLLVSGLPALSPDGLIAIAGEPSMPFGANGEAGKDPQHLVLLQTDGKVVSSLPLSRNEAYEEADDATLTQRLEAARALLSKHSWRTMRPMVAVAWNDGENDLTPAFYAPDGRAVFELSKWSVTVDLAAGRFRATLPEVPRAPFLDDMKMPCEVLRYPAAAYLDPALDLALVSLVHFSTNSSCATKLTIYAPFKLPGEAGGEGWTAAKRGPPPPWFEDLTSSILDADHLGEDGTLEAEDRVIHEAFVAVWGDRYPKHKSVRSARKLLELDRKNRTLPTEP